MSNGIDESWSSARYILQKIDKECTVAKVRHHALFRRELQERIDACNYMIRANSNVITDDVKKILEQNCSSNGVPQMLILNPEAQLNLALLDETRVFNDQFEQYTKLTKLVSDEKLTAKEYDPNIYLVLDLDHTIINTYEYNSQVR